MGMCLNMKGDEFCPGEDPKNQLQISKSKDAFHFQHGNTDEYTPMKCNVDDHSPNNIPQQQHQQQQQQQQQFDVPQPSKQKQSNFNLYQKTSTPNNIINNGNSNLLFESFSYVSRSIDNSSMIDHYQYARNIFDRINEMRNNPQLFSVTLDTIITSATSTTSTTTTTTAIKPLSQSKDFTDLKECITRTDRNTFQVIQTYLNAQDTGDPILWNEKVYLTISQYLIDVETKSNWSANEAITKSSNRRVSERLERNCNVVEFNLNGLYSSEVCVWLFLVENVNRIEMLLKHNYDFGAVCCYPTNNNYKMRTILYLVNQINSNNIYIKNAHNIDEKYNLTTFINTYDLSNKIDNTYIHKITGGLYEINVDTRQGNVEFTLYDGNVLTFDFTAS